MTDTLTILRMHAVKPTPQRIAIAEAILRAKTHLSADEVWKIVKKDSPTISRATVYNTLNLLAEKGVLRTQIIKEGRVVYDPRVEPHHHFIDEKTNEIHDIPWNAVKVRGQNSLKDFEVNEYQVVMRGRKKK